MIATLTLNPAIDKTAYIESLQIGELNRMCNVRTSVGGKGINVSRAIRSLKGKTEVFTIVAGAAGQLVEDYLRSNYFVVHLVKAEGSTRTNIKIIDAENRMTEINDEGPTVTKDVLNLLLIRMMRTLKKEDYLILSGSIPAGVPDDIYQRIILEAKEKGVHTILDADGIPFQKGIEAVPEIIKPNIHELRNYFGITDQIDAQQAAVCARKLTEKGIRLAVVSMGHQGAVYAWPDEVLFSPAVSVKTDSTVGAGDAMVGGIALADSMKMDREKLIRMSMASGAASCTSHAMNPLVIQNMMDEVKIEKMEGVQ